MPAGLGLINSVDFYLTTRPNNTRFPMKKPNSSVHHAKSLLMDEAGGMIIMMSFLILGAVGASTFFGQSNTSSVQMMMEHQKKSSQASLLERSIRNGVVYALEKQTCVDPNVALPTDLKKMWDELVKFKEDKSINERYVTSYKKSPTSTDLTADLQCFLGVKEIRQLRSMDLEVWFDESSRLSSSKTTFRVQVDVTVEEIGKSKDTMKVSASTQDYQQQMVVSKVNMNRLGFIFRVDSSSKGFEISSPIDVIFDLPVFVYNQSSTSVISGISERFVGRGGKSFRFPIFTNFQSMFYHPLMPPKNQYESVGDSKVVFEKGVSVGRLLSDDVSDYFDAAASLTASVGTTDADEFVGPVDAEAKIWSCRRFTQKDTDSDNSDAAKRKPVYVSGNGTVKIEVQSSMFCGYVIADTLEINISQPAGDKAKTDTDGEIVMLGSFYVKKIVVKSQVTSGVFLTIQSPEFNPDASARAMPPQRGDGQGQGGDCYTVFDNTISGNVTNMNKKTCEVNFGGGAGQDQVMIFM